MKNNDWMETDDTDNERKPFHLNGTKFQAFNGYTLIKDLDSKRTNYNAHVGRVLSHGDCAPFSNGTLILFNARATSYQTSDIGTVRDRFIFGKYTMSPKKRNKPKPKHFKKPIKYLMVKDPTAKKWLKAPEKDFYVIPKGLVPNKVIKNIRSTVGTKELLLDDEIFKYFYHKTMFEHLSQKAKQDNK